MQTAITEDIWIKGEDLIQHPCCCKESSEGEESRDIEVMAAMGDADFILIKTLKELGVRYSINHLNGMPN